MDINVKSVSNFDPRLIWESHHHTAFADETSELRNLEPSYTCLPKRRMDVVDIGHEEFPRSEAALRGPRVETDQVTRITAEALPVPR